MFFVARILRKVAGFFLHFFTPNRQRHDHNSSDRQPFNEEDRGEYETLNRSHAPACNHPTSAAIRIGIHGENNEKSCPGKSTSKVGDFAQIKPKGIPPLPPPPCVVRSKSIDPGTKEVVDLSGNSSPFSSQPPPLSFKPSPSSPNTPQYETLNRSPAPSYNHLTSGEIRIGLHGENNEKFSPSKSTGKVGSFAQIKPKGIPPLPSPPCVLRSESIDPGAKKLVDLSVSGNSSPFLSEPPPFSFKPAPSSANSPQLPSSIRPPQFSSDPPPSSSKLPSSKPTLSPLPSNQINQQMKTNYLWIEKDSSPIYVIPEEIKGLIKKDIAPGVLKKPLSPSTYKDYFAALLYAEDFYVEKWSDFKLLNVTLELDEAAIYKKSDKKKYLNECDEKDDKIFVAFEMNSVREKRPFLLSRDFVFVRPAGSKVEPFQGIIYRVVRSTRVLVEFGKDFHSQHHPTRKYDVSFSFNRFCLKRAHQAVEAASDPLFRNFLFPNSISRNSLFTSHTFLSPNNELDFEQTTAIRQILRLKSPPPFLVEGPLSVINGKHGKGKELSKTGLVVREAVLHLYLTSPKCRILVCAPTNGTCDVLMSSLKTDIRESDMFRANAAFREVDGVPYEILPSCLYKDECFVCPSLQELRHFKVIFSTFVSSFRLHGAGISAGHFSHIFLLDASSTIEPEVMVVLANLANEETAVVVTGANGNRSGWVRSDIARRNRLQISYFERLCESKPYKSSDPTFITRLGITSRDSDDTYSVRSFS